MRLTLALMALLLATTPALARDPWGGPDSPGGLFGGFGDPTRLDRDRDSRITHDEIWSWLLEQFNLIDRNRDGRLGPDELPRRALVLPAFRAADADHDNHLTREELRALSESWFRARDVNRDRALSGREVPRPPPAPPQR
ncbi:MAG: hypothetical protein RMK64_07385 [Rhodovarius sp.]|nr:hypothetical protein [Rhodovarius sp.]MCX7930940.1 hypothetical protein [Rhodovarius sp.]MDW8314776.1 hypothetical protein [Rhodovarius sp.]